MARTPSHGHRAADLARKQIAVGARHVSRPVEQRHHLRRGGTEVDRGADHDDVRVLHLLKNGMEVVVLLIAGLVLEAIAGGARATALDGLVPQGHQLAFDPPIVQPIETALQQRLGVALFAGTAGDSDGAHGEA